VPIRIRKLREVVWLRPARGVRYKSTSQICEHAHYYAKATSEADHQAAELLGKRLLGIREEGHRLER